MMTVHPLGPDGFRYLIESVTRQDEIPDRPVPHRRIRGDLASYYLRTGNPPGEWTGSLAEQLGVTGTVTEQQMARLFGNGQHPVTGEQLGRRYPRFAPLSERVAARERALAPRPDRTEEGRQWGLAELSDGEFAELDGYALAAVRERTGRQIDPANTALTGLDGMAQHELIRIQEHRRTRDRVAGVDLVFAPPKSVQSLWALATIAGDAPTRDRVETWIRAARDTTLRELETRVAFGRLGAGGTVWVPVDGLAAAAFLHRSSRAGDPNLHWHVAVASKVRVRDPRGAERWVALDTMSLHKAAVSLSEMFNGEVERLAMADGYHFAPRPDQAQHGSRAVRELVGIPDALNRAWSRRRIQVEDNYQRLLTGFRAEKNRDPLPQEQYRLAQQACLMDRPAKARNASAEDEIVFWEHLARQALGEKTDLRKVIAAARGKPDRATVDLTDSQRAEIVRSTVAAVAERRPWWTVRHLQAEAERQTRGLRFATTADRKRAVSRIVADATTPDRHLGPGQGLVVRAERRSVVAEPPRLLRQDGESVFREPAATEYTTTRMLAAEDRVLAAAATHGAPHISAAAVEQAILRAADGGLPLAPDQEAAIRALAGSGRWLDLLIGPAGAGKTTTLRVLVDAAHADGWTVVGLAPSAKAAAILGANTGVQIVENTRQWELFLATGRVRPRPRTLVLIDEASLGHAPTLDAIITAHLRAGGIARLVGDPKQLTSPGAGGLLRWVHQQHGGVELTSLWRFKHEWEAAATLRLRDGDPRVFTDYLEHDRVRHGTAAAMKDDLYRWWLAQRAAGRTALMLVQSNVDVADLSARARRDLVAAGLVEKTGTRLRDGNDAGRGDQVVTRRVDRTLRYNGGKDYVRNGDVWQVTIRHDDGSLTLRHADSHGRLRLTSDWLNQWAELAYAVTGTRAQGMTVDAAGSLLYPEATTRNAAYTQLTRGTGENLLFLVTDTVLDPDGDPVDHTNLDPQAAFTAILGRVEDDTVAHERLAGATDTEQSIRTLSTRYRYAYDLLLAEHAAVSEDAAAIDPDRTADLANLPAPLASAIHADPAWPALAARLQAVAALGRSPGAELAGAVAMRELSSADSVAQVLHWRLGQRIPELNESGPSPRAGNLRNERIPVAPWLPVPPVDVPAPFADLATYLDRTRAAIETRAATLAAASVGSPWTSALGPVPAAGLERGDWLLLAARIAAYREAFSVDDPSPLGALPAEPRRAQQMAYEALATALADHRSARGEPRTSDSSTEPRADASTVDKGRNRAAPPGDHHLLASLSNRELLANLREAVRDADGAKRRARTLAARANDLVAAAEDGRGPAVRQLHAERDRLAETVAAIATAEPLAAAYQAAVKGLTAAEDNHSTLLRRLAHAQRRGPIGRSAARERRDLAAQAASLEPDISQRRTDLEPLAVSLGEATATAGPTHQWSATRAQLADLDARWSEALTAAHAIDRAAAEPWLTRAATYTDHANHQTARAAALRAELQRRGITSYPNTEPEPDVRYGPPEPDVAQLGYPYPQERPPAPTYGPILQP
jgi:conjugative relaxase-like TrwC/TraI family protein